MNDASMTRTDYSAYPPATEPASVAQPVQATPPGGYLTRGPAAEYISAVLGRPISVAELHRHATR